MPFQNGQYRLPTDVQELQQLATTARGSFAQRDQRMRLVQRWYEQKMGAQDRGIQVTLSTPTTLIRKAAAMIASRAPRINVAARRQEQDTLAQQIEDFLAWWRRTAEIRYGRGVRNPLVYDEAFWILLRGWVVGRLLLDPTDEQFPFAYELLDPLQVYPMLAGDRVLYVVHAYQPTVATVLAEWPDLETMLGDRRETDTVRYLAVYTDLEFAVVVEDQVVKPPTEHQYGFNPILIGLAAGAAYRDSETGQDWDRYMGSGLLDPVLQAIDDRQRLLLMYWERVAREGDPPVIINSENGELVDIDLQARGRTVLGLQDRVQVLQYGASAASVGPLLELLQMEQDRGTLGPGAFVDGAKYPSGFAETIAAGSARDALWPFVRGLERYYDQLLRNVLQLYARFWPPDRALHYVATDPASGRQTAWNALDPRALQDADVEIECAFRGIVAENEMLKAQIGYQAAQARLLDLDTIRQRYFDIDRPQSTNERVLADLVLQNPQLIQILSMAAALRSQNPYILAGLQALQQAQVLKAQQPPPAEAQQPPNMALPDELGQNAGLPPNEATVGGIPSPGAGAPSLPGID
jgi:hypothetical protein